MSKEQTKELEQALGKDTAKEVIRLQKNCDKYLLKFKADMNKLLKQHGKEVLCGVVYRELESK